jgi:YHS domain-containing protein
MLSDGVTYYFVVSAANRFTTGPNSAPASAMPYAPLVAPTNVRATPGSGQATLTWSPVSGAGWYTVKFSKTSGGPYSTGIAKVVGTTATVSMLSDGVTYYFVVSAGNRFTTGPNSSQVSAMPHSG